MQNFSFCLSLNRRTFVNKIFQQLKRACKFREQFIVKNASANRKQSIHNNCNYIVKDERNDKKCQNYKQLYACYNNNLALDLSTPRESEFRDKTNFNFKNFNSC